MRVRPLSRAPPTSSLCIFCATRFLGVPLLASTSPAPPRRFLNTTRPPYQSAAATAQAEAVNGNPNEPPTAPTWDPNSTLTAAERAEREQRQRLRVEAEAEVRRRAQAQAAEQERRKTAQSKQREELHRAREVHRDGGRGVEVKRREAPPQHTAAGTERGQQRERERLGLEERRIQAEERDRASSRSLFGPAHAQQPRSPRMSKPMFGGGSTATSSSQSAQAFPSIDWSETEPPHIRPLQYRNEGEDAIAAPTPQGTHSSENRGLASTGREYQATLFQDNEYPVQQSQPANETSSDSWRHLPQRHTSSTHQPPPRPDPPQRSQKSDESIERAFAEHQRNRRPRSQQPFYANPNPNIQDAANSPLASVFQEGSARAAQRCTRCLEPGHHARDCTGPIRATCRVCGQSGHFARDCQLKQRRPSDSPFSGVADAGGRQRSAGKSAFAGELQQSSATGEGERSYEMQGTSSLFQPLGGSISPMGRNEQQAESVTHDLPSQDMNTAEERQDDRRMSRNRRGFEDEAAAVENVVRESGRTRRQGRRSVAAQDDEAADEAASLREQRAARKAARKASQKAGKAAEKRESGATISLPEFISVSQLAQALEVHYDHFVSRLEKLGYDDIFPGKVLNAETSGMIAMEYNFEPIFEDSAEKLEEGERDLKARPEVEDKTFLPSRPPVVAIMGHVDHGKTTILDFLRKSSVAAGEAGGITQHIGAFSVPLSGSGKSITFLDTPGHAAFLAMRQRGANVTDIVILVVAADDSVKPQTIESIRCAREAGVPILVAINKIDKEESDIQRVKQDLARNGVEIEDFGGDTQVVCVSGKTGQGMEELEEAAITLSEILDHRSEMDGNVEGWVLEATTKKAGRVATVLVKRGTLRPGTVIVAGKTWARVRTLKNEAGQLVQEATPGIPVEVDGWRDQAVAGDEVLQALTEQKATDVVAYRIEKEERGRTAQDMEAINEARRLEQERRAREKAEEKAAKAGLEVTTKANTASVGVEQESGQLKIPFIIKADVSGSAEAVSAYIPSLTSPLITPQILHSGVGAVHESDIELASAAQGHIIAFNLPSNPEAKGAAEARGVKILENNIIYRVLDDVKAVLEEKLPPIVTQRVLGEAEISATFDIKVGGRKVIWIAGCKVRNGVIGRGSRVRVMRGSEKVYDGLVSSLKNVKKDVQEMRKGSECGMGFEEWEAFQVGDQVQTYEEISEKRRL